MIGSVVAAVTGANGFVGRALVSRLFPDAPTRVLVRRCDERAAGWRRQGIDVVVGDLGDDSVLARLVRDADVVYHCAAHLGKSDAALSHEVNVLGTERVARAALDAGVRRFVYVSSISVYGATRQPDATITETVSPEHVDLLNNYARTKYEGELRVRALGMVHGLPYTIVRPTNIYGPGSGPWFHQFARMLRRLPIALGDFPIDVVHVDDVVSALIQCAHERGAAGQIFHVGHEMVRLSEFIRRVGRVTGRRARTLPPRVDLFVRRTIDRLYRTATGRHMSLSLVRPVRYPHTKATAAFGYAPRVALDEGFARLAAWYGSAAVDSDAEAEAIAATGVGA